MTSLPVARVDQIPPGSTLGIQIELPAGVPGGAAKVIGPSQAGGPPGSVPVVVVHTADDQWFALGDICSHRPILLSMGQLEGCQLECPGHGARFDLRTGQPLNPPAMAAVPTYPVSVRDQQVWVDLGVSVAGSSGNGGQEVGQ